MSNTNDFDRQIINFRERPISDDVNEAQSILDTTRRNVLLARFATSANATPNGVLGTGLAVAPTAPATLGVQVGAGDGFLYNGADVPTSIGSIPGVDDLSPYKPAILSQIQSVPLDSAPGAGQERYDLVEASYARKLGNTLSRDVFNLGALAFQPNSVPKTLSFDMFGSVSRVISPANSPGPDTGSGTGAIGYKRGVAAAVGTAVIPSVSPGYQPLAVVYVGPAASSITAPNIIDWRRQLTEYGLVTATCTFTLPLGALPAPPTGFAFQAPPGVVIVPVTFGTVGSFGGRAVSVYVFNLNSAGGALPLVASAVAGIGSNNTSMLLTLDAIGVLQDANQFGIVTSGVQAAASGANSGNPYTPPLGANYNRFDFYPRHFPAAGGAIDQTFVNAPTFTVSMSFAV